MKVEVSGRAYEDLDQFATCLGRQQRGLGDRFLVAAADTFERLAESPTLGERTGSRLKSMAGVRRWHVRGFPNHLVFYRPTDDGVLIVRLQHSASDWARRMAVDP